MELRVGKYARLRFIAPIIDLGLLLNRIDYIYSNLFVRIKLRALKENWVVYFRMENERYILEQIIKIVVKLN